MPATVTTPLSPAGALPCAQCGTMLKRPAWSEPVGARQICHLWNCRDCAYVFETLVFYCTDDAAQTAAPPLAA